MFCFFLPETNTRRPPRPAYGRLTRTSVVSNRSSTPSAWAVRARQLSAMVLAQVYGILLAYYATRTCRP